MSDCIFCKIIDKELPAKIVYEDEEIIAFYDINPAAKVHVLVIPKKHIPSLIDVAEEDAGIISKIYVVINKIVKDLGLDKSGFRVIMNCGEDGGQVVGHLHFHILGGEHLGTKIVR